jgi:hypothetical protein
MGAQERCPEAVVCLQMSRHPRPPRVRVNVLHPPQELENHQVALAVPDRNGRLKGQCAFGEGVASE